MNPMDEVRGLFSDYRAEWPPARFAELFVRPGYYGKLEDARPCVLFGGRGTGKTTALRSLRFDAAQTRTLREAPTHPRVECLPYVGLYLRIDKNQARAFEGPELPERTWAKVFAHYFNLLVAKEFGALLHWVTNERPEFPAPDGSFVARAAAALCLSCPAQCTTADSLATKIDDALIEVEIYVNNPARSPCPLLSIAESPVRHLAALVADQAWANGKPIFCCVDEYENLLSFQQSVVNTYIKHSSAPLSYKIGVRSNGLHSHRTIDEGDQLQTPDDYVEIDIPQEQFEQFARQVAETRLSHAASNDLPVPTSLDDFLETLTIEDEALLLGARRIADNLIESLAGRARDFLQTQSPARVALVSFWHEAHPAETERALVSHWMKNPRKWEHRWGNYSYAMLFWLSKGRKGQSIKKYYSGAATLIAMAAGNIRYFIELLDRSIDEQQRTVDIEHCAAFTLSAKAQTVAATKLAQKRLEQLEGVSENGTKLKRLVLGIGRVFFERTRTAGTAPEQNLFVLSGDAASVFDMTAVLDDGAAHLAFEAHTRTMRTSSGEPNDSAYRVHPIYSAFFNISHRKKRRVTFDAHDLQELVENPSAGITHLLGAEPTPDDDLPEQLALFAPYYHSTKEAS